MDNIIYENGSLKILDQTLLPNEEKYITMKSLEECIEAIKKTANTRRARHWHFCPVIRLRFLTVGDIKAAKAALDAARPTAVNLSWATARIAEAAKAGKNLIAEAKAIHAEDIELCRKISEYGLSLLKDGDGILTHCNAGELATSKYGTGLGPLIFGQGKGLHLSCLHR